MSANNPTGNNRPCREKANLHPGRVLLAAQGKRRTPQEKKADDMRVKADREAHAAAFQQGQARIGKMEAAMAARQSAQGADRMKPVRPRSKDNQPRPTVLSTVPCALEEMIANANLIPTFMVPDCIQQDVAFINGQWSKPAVPASRALRRQGALYLRDDAPPFTNKVGNFTPLSSNKFNALQNDVNEWAEGISGGPQPSTPFNSIADPFSHPPTSATPSLGSTYSGNKDEREQRMIATGNHGIAMWAAHHGTPDIDDELGGPISDSVFTGLKHKHTDHDESQFMVISDTEEVGDRNSDFDGLPANVGDHRMTTKTNIKVENTVKKARISDTSEVHEATSHTTTPSQFTSAFSTMSSRTCYINSDLPSALQEDRKWTKQILPALITWAGDQPDPWAIPDQDLVHALRTIISNVAPNFEDVSTIDPGAAIFNLATRRLSIWRSSFGSTAIPLIGHFIAVHSQKKPPPPGPHATQAPPLEPPISESLTLEEACSYLLNGYRFLYERLDSSDPANAYRSHFVLPLLTSCHIQPCLGCPDIQSLDTDTLKWCGIRGALALCSAVLERTICLFESGELQVDSQMVTPKARMKTPLKANKATGKESTSSFNFSEQNWGICTREYFESISTCSHNILHEILNQATTIAHKEMRRAESKLDGSVGPAPRANICAAA